MVCAASVWQEVPWWGRRCAFRPSGDAGGCSQPAAGRAPSGRWFLGPRSCWARVTLLEGSWLCGSGSNVVGMVVLKPVEEKGVMQHHRHRFCLPAAAEASAGCVTSNFIARLEFCLAKLKSVKATPRQKRGHPTNSQYLMVFLIWGPQNLHNAVCNPLAPSHPPRVGTSRCPQPFPLHRVMGMCSPWTHCHRPWAKRERMTGFVGLNSAKLLLKNCCCMS